MRMISKRNQTDKYSLWFLDLPFGVCVWYDFVIWLLQWNWVHSNIRLSIEHSIRLHRIVRWICVFNVVHPYMQYSATHTHSLTQHEYLHAGTSTCYCTIYSTKFRSKLKVRAVIADAVAAAAVLCMHDTLCFCFRFDLIWFFLSFCFAQIDRVEWNKIDHRFLCFHSNCFKAFEFAHEKQRKTKKSQEMALHNCDGLKDLVFCFVWILHGPIQLNQSIKNCLLAQKHILLRNSNITCQFVWLMWRNRNVRRTHRTHMPKHAQRQINRSTHWHCCHSNLLLMPT